MRGWIVFALLLIGTSGSLNHPDALFLDNLYTFTNGAQWNQPWNREHDPCTWSGVTCQNGSLFELDVSARGIVGMLPATPPGSLQTTVSITFANNPGLKGWLSALKAPITSFMDVGNCQLSGKLPVSHWPKVYTLALSSNVISGHLEDAFFLEHPNFVSVDLSNNLISGSFPDALDRSNIVYLSVKGNNMTGTIPPSLSHSPRLQQIDLGNNWFSGNLPSLTSSSAMREFVAPSNKLSGTLPDLPDQVATFDVAFNHLSGILPVPPAMLRYMKLGANDISGVLASEWKQVYTLDLSSNWIEGTIPHLEASTLDLSDNCLSGHLPDILYGESTRSLDYSNNYLSGWVPSQHLDHGPVMLESFSVASNHFSGFLPASMQNMSHIKDLNLFGNKISGTIPVRSFPDSMPVLRRLILGGNRFRTPLPKLFAEDSNLLLLDITGVSLNLSLPQFLYTTFQTKTRKAPEIMTSLSVLLASKSMLTGSLTGDLFRMFPNLVTLSLSDNDLQGLLPQGVRFPRFLQRLDISNNRLTGDLPGNLGLAISSSLHIVELTGNHFLSSGAKLPYFLTHAAKGETTSEDGHYSCPLLTDSQTKTAMIHLEARYYDYSMCKCNTNYIGSGSSCFPAASLCLERDRNNCYENAANNTLHISYGYWPSPSTTDVKKLLPCLDDGCGATHCVVDSAQTLCTANCVAGTGGRLCSQCVILNGRQYYRDGNVCTPCPDSTLMFWLLPLCFLILFCVIIIAGRGGPKREQRKELPRVVQGALDFWRSVKYVTSQGVLKSLIIYLQTIQVLFFEASFWMQETSFFKTALRGTMERSAFALRGLECLSPELFSYTGQLGFYVLLPIILVMSVIFIGVVIATVRQTVYGGMTDEISRDLQERCFSAIVFMLYLVYFTICNRCLAVFNCVTDPTPSVSHTFLANAPWLRCYTHTWQRAAALSIIGLVFVSALMMGIAREIYKRHGEGRLGDPPVLARFGLMYAPYAQEYWWFEAAIMIRRVILAGCISLVRPENIFKPLLISAVLLGAFAFQVALQPFRTQLGNVAESVTLAAVIISYVGIEKLESAGDDNGAEVLGYLIVVGNAALSLGCIVAMSIPFVRELYSRWNSPPKSGIVQGDTAWMARESDLGSSITGSIQDTTAVRIPSRVIPGGFGYDEIEYHSYHEHRLPAEIDRSALLPSTSLPSATILGS